MAEKHTIEWEEISPLILRFTVWSGTPELSWFKKAWNGLSTIGLTQYSNDEERHWVYVRAITLGIMYGEYCYLEWDEYSDASSLLTEVYWDEDISHTRIGNMVEKNFVIALVDEQELFYNVVMDLVSQMRLEVFDAISRGFGGDVRLYTGLYISREEGNDQENLDERFEDAIDASYSPKGREEAFQYVVNASMQAIDA